MPLATPPAGVKGMRTRRVKSGHCVKTMNPKNTPIRENADANITCDFGDGDISRLGVANQTHVYKHRSSVSSIILRCNELLFNPCFMREYIIMSACLILSCEYAR